MFDSSTQALRLRRRLWAMVALVSLVPIPTWAKPSAPKVVCDGYVESPLCLGQVPSCELCHTSTGPVGWNEYGASLLAGRDADASFEAWLPAAMRAVEDEDSDADGVSNLEELLLGTRPGDAVSRIGEVEAPTDDNPFYALGRYDAELALRRAGLAFCGRSPSFDERRALVSADSPEDQRLLLHAFVDDCLRSDYWLETVLPALADLRVRPVWGIGADTTITSMGFPLILADYHWDYRLWVYVLTNDRDLRELLTADYYVLEDETGALVPTRDTIANPPGQVAGGQPLAPEHRAGMLTTQWFLMSNTMFSAVPRGTAAQAYRGYLGLDLSQTEGVLPVANEPRDLDAKGVAEPDCAQCHSTLDPLSYAFSYYRGIEQIPGFTGAFDPGRPERLVPGWNDADPQTVVLGQPVASVVEWAAVAAESDAFAVTMARMFFEHGLGREVRPEENDDLLDVVETMAADGYSANKLIHRLVDTDAFGAG